MDELEKELERAKQRIEGLLDALAALAILETAARAGTDAHVVDHVPCGHRRGEYVCVLEKGHIGAHRELLQPGAACAHWWFD